MNWMKRFVALKQCRFIEVECDVKDMPFFFSYQNMQK